MKTLCFIFYKFFEKKNLLNSITWPLTPNFHHPVKKIILLLPANFHFRPHWQNFYNMLFSSFKRFEWSKSLLLRFPPPHKNFPSSKIPMSPMGRYPRVSHRCWEHGELQSIHGEEIRVGVVEMLLKNICEGVHTLVNLPAISLQAYKFSKNELLHTYFSRILTRF